MLSGFGTSGQSFSKGRQRYPPDKSLSIGAITIQWISVNKTNQWILIYPVDRVIHLLNNPGLSCIWSTFVYLQQCFWRKVQILNIITCSRLWKNHTNAYRHLIVISWCRNKSTVPVLQQNKTTNYAVYTSLSYPPSSTGLLGATLDMTNSLIGSSTQPIK